MSEKITRREFVSTVNKTSLGLGLGALALPAMSHGRVLGANERIHMGLIGCGSMGTHNMKNALAEGAQVLAVCDVDAGRMRAAAEEVTMANQEKPEQLKDFRKLLERKDIDAVIIGTPDHWHALPFIAACESGKDIYCEKPLAHDIRESRAMANAAGHFERVAQIGTWHRSVQHFVDAIDFVRSGKLGKIAVCRAWILSDMGSIGKARPQKPPQELDWDFWLGPAPYAEYRPNRCHFNWRWFMDYGSGLSGDWGVHVIDIVLLGMQQWSPKAVDAMGGKLVYDDDRTTPDTLCAIYEFDGFTMTWELRFGNVRGLDGGRDHGAEFIGTNGTLIVDRSNWQVFPEKDKLKDGDSPTTRNALPSKGKDAIRAHMANFLECMKTRQKPRSDADSMHQTTTACLLSNVALFAGRRLHWDGEKEVITGDPAAMEALSFQREYRAPWKLTNYET